MTSNTQFVGSIEEAQLLYMVYNAYKDVFLFIYLLKLFRFLMML